jgi:flagellar hook-associated protein 3 FlgL
MTVASISGQSAAAVRQLVTLRAQLEELQRQFATGKKSTTYAGLGINRGVAVGLNAQLSAIDGFNNTINSILPRIKVADLSLTRLREIGADVRKAVQTASGIGNGGGVVPAQKVGQDALVEALDLLNTRAGDRFVFSGRATDTESVASADLILNGDGVRAGLKQLIDERKQADLGTTGPGRLPGRLAIANPTATSISITEDNAPPFGFKFAPDAPPVQPITSTLTNANVTNTVGPPASVSVEFTGVPNPDETLTLRFDLPDGTSSSVTLTATNDSPPGANEFTIGADAATTTTNLQTALTASIGKLAATSLTAASAVQASNEFFDTDALTPPLRVAGPPFDTATALVNGNSADTVFWYTGEAGTDPARSSVTAKIDVSISVGYGVRANEIGIRSQVQNIATLAAITVPTTDPNAIDLSSELDSRLNAGLLGGPSIQSIPDIESDLGNAQGTIKTTQDRHKQASSSLNGFLDTITGVSNEETGAKILTLQTRLEASLQTTAILFQTSLTKFL